MSLEKLSLPYIITDKQTEDVFLRVFHLVGRRRYVKKLITRVVRNK